MDSESQRTPFLKCTKGQAFFALPESIVLAVGTPDCKVAKLSFDQFSELDQRLATGLLEDWLLGSSRAVAPKIQEARLLEIGETLSLEKAEFLGSNITAWAETSGQALSYAESEKPLSSFVPLTPVLHVTALNQVEVSGIDTPNALSHRLFWAGLNQYHLWVCERLVELQAESGSTQERRIQEREASKSAAMGRGLRRLAKVMPGEAVLIPISKESDNLLFESVRKVAEAKRIQVSRRPSTSADDLRDPLTQIAQSSGFRTRMIKLADRWWQGDVGPSLLASSDGQPVAVIQVRPGRYQIYDFAKGTKTAVDGQIAQALDPEAYVFYRPLPHDCTTFFDLFKFALPAIVRDLAILTLVCLLGALMAMAMPIGLGLLVSPVIPSGQVTELGALGLGLGLAIVVSTCAGLSRAITILRIGGLVDADVQAAITDRLMGLPAPFFRRYSSGDLTNRLLGFQSMVKTATGTAFSAVMAGLMSSTNLLLMIYYDRWLALIGFCMVLILFGFLVICGFIDLGLQRELARARGALNGLVFQLIGGISKLRVAAAQPRAFEVWTREFAKRTRVVYASDLIQANINSVMPIYNTASLIVFFAYLAHYKYEGIAISDFLALTAAYGAFVGAVNTAARSLTTLLTTIPLAERFQPILAEAAEVAESLPDPGELRGAVEICNVSFRYGPDEPRVLKDVSLKAEPGEFVAVVGPSGSGKSTIFRMLVGFETPNQGTVLYDGQDLAGLNLQAVRRQLGVVLQNGKLMPGSVVSNIIGSSLLSLDDAWAAAEVAGIADDIRALPMGMHTMVSEGGSAFSGGQSQRVLIARAVVSKPKILLLDEATSALDSKTQYQVSEQLTNLRATRIVIAHRLSTIEHADRIYVVKDGEVVQVGNYEELVSVPGTFQELAKRQLL
jgi:NHLM bacteriocin system ABC transporter ATP-binding protein